MLWAVDNMMHLLYSRMQIYIYIMSQPFPVQYVIPVRAPRPKI